MKTKILYPNHDYWFWRSTIGEQKVLNINQWINYKATTWDKFFTYYDKSKKSILPF